MRGLRAARLFDGERRIDDPLVLIEDGLIAAVRSGGEPPHDLTDLGDVTLLPGLIDPHVHLVMDAIPPVVERLTEAGDDLVLERARAGARQSLAAGVTTVRDLGDRSYLGLELDDEDGATVLAAGPPLTVPGGHCWFLGGEVSGMSALRDGVRERAERGVHVIKAMATGGALTPGSRPQDRQFSDEELRAIADEAHRHGLPVTAHAHTAAGIAAALDAGFDGIEHCTFVTGVDEDLVRRLAATGTAVSFTLGALPGTEPAPEQEALVRTSKAALQALYAGGVNLLCSSDAGIFASKPHPTLTYSLEEMAEQARIPPGDMVRMATVSAAAAIGLGDRKGRIAPGYDADLLAVKGDPLTDLSVLREVRAVYRSGRRTV